MKKVAATEMAAAADGIAEGKEVTEAAAATDASAAASESTAEAKEKTEAAATTQVSDQKKVEDKDEEILALIQERRTINKDEGKRIREVSKKIKKCIRVQRGMQEKTKFRRFWKNSKEQGTSPMSYRQSREFSSRESRKRKAR